MNFSLRFIRGPVVSWFRLWLKDIVCPVESQNFGIPVFARDIPVFREIGRTFKNITFYDGGNPREVAKQFLDWKSSLNVRNHREKKGSKTICWKKATKRSSENHNCLTLDFDTSNSLGTLC